MKRRDFLLALAGSSLASAALSPLSASGASAAARHAAQEAAHRTAGKALPRLKTLQLATDNLSFGYHSAGPEEGRPVVLLHDFAYDIHSFAEVIPLLVAQGWRVVVPYLRGHGGTRFNDKSAPRSGQPDALGADTLAVIDSLHMPEAVVAGFGQGAVAARAFARLKPTRCKGIVAADGAWQPGPERAALMRDRRAFVRKLWQTNSPADPLQGAAFDALFARAAMSFDNPDFVPVLSDFGSAAPAAVPSAVPVLALHGAASGIAAADPAARLVAGAGHDLPREAPQAFAAAIGEMVRSARWRT